MLHFKGSSVHVFEQFVIVLRLVLFAHTSHEALRFCRCCRLSPRAPACHRRATRSQKRRAPRSAPPRRSRAAAASTRSVPRYPATPRPPRRPGCRMRTLRQRACRPRARGLSPAIRCQNAVQHPLRCLGTQLCPTARFLHLAVRPFWRLRQRMWAAAATSRLRSTRPTLNSMPEALCSSHRWRKRAPDRSLPCIAARDRRAAVRAVTRTEAGRLGAPP